MLDFKIRFQCYYLCFVVIVGLGKWAEQEEKRMWKPWAWSKEATEEMSGFGKQSSRSAISLLTWSLAESSLV